MGLRITLDTTQLNDLPKGWEKAKYKSKRDPKIKGLFTIYVTDLQFWGDGFDYIDGVMSANYCQTIEVTIESDDCQAGNWVTEFNGIIKLTEITKLDIDQRIITTKIFDESFGARISNNKSLKALVNVGTSKNGESITPVTYEDVFVFDPTANFATYEATARQMFRAWNCFHFIIQYITDGEVDFISDYFDVGGEGYNTFITNGSELRKGNGNGTQLEISFKTLFAELDKKYNLSFAVEPNPSTYTNPYRVRVEPTSYFEQDDAQIQLDNIRGIDLDFNKEALYSDINIGSDNFNDDVAFSYPPLNFKTFREENYTILGQCNVDNTLDLVSNWIIDTNVIEDIVVNSVSKYDDKNAIVMTDDNNKALKSKPYGEPLSIGVTSGLTSANKLIRTTGSFITDGVSIGDMAVNLDTGLKTNVTSIDSALQLGVTDDYFSLGSENFIVKDGPFAYNQPLNNYNVVSRYLGGLPNSVVKYLSTSSSANFWAKITSSVVDTVYPATISPVEYDDDSTPPFFDDGNNYDTSGFYYDVPNSGLYGFLATAVFKLNGQLDTTSLIVNGDFSATPASTGWSYWQSGANITNSNGYTHTFGGAGINNLFLRSNSINFQANRIYILQFNCVVDCGAIRINSPFASGDTYVTTSGLKTVVIDLTNIGNLSLPTNFEFRFEYVTGQTGFCFNNSKVQIDSVEIYATPKFEITQTIERRSSANVLLQSFTTSYEKVFGLNQVQDIDYYEAQNTFSIFKNERVRVKIEINGVTGSNLQSELLPVMITGAFSDPEYTSLKTISVDDGGGDILPVNPNDFPIYKYEFKKALTFEQWKLLKDDPKSAVLFSNTENNHLFGWRNSIEYDRRTSETSFVLRSKKKINTNC